MVRIQRIKYESTVISIKASYTLVTFLQSRKTDADPHHGYSAISELLEPMFSVQTWMVETEEKVSSGFDWNLC